MSQKHPHCTAICAIPNTPAKQLRLEFTRQHAMSSRDSGSARMYASAKLRLVVPISTKYGDIPALLRRATIV
jgi:DNA primase